MNYTTLGAFMAGMVLSLLIVGMCRGPVVTNDAGIRSFCYDVADEYRGMERPRAFVMCLEHMERK